MQAGSSFLSTSFCAWSTRPERVPGGPTRSEKHAPRWEVLELRRRAGWRKELSFGATPSSTGIVTRGGADRRTLSYRPVSRPSSELSPLATSSSRPSVPRA